MITPNLVARTVTSAPSYQAQGLANLFVDPNQLRAEIAPWYAARPDIIIELGNEPNIAPLLRSGDLLPPVHEQERPADTPLGDCTLHARRFG